MESKDYFDAVSVATNNAEKKTKNFMTPRVRLPTWIRAKIIYITNSFFLKVHVHPVSSKPVISHWPFLGICSCEF